MRLWLSIASGFRRVAEAVIGRYLAVLDAFATAGARVGALLSRRVRLRSGRAQWNPLRWDAWYWGRRDPELRRGMTFSTLMHVLIIASFMLPALFGGGNRVEEYFLPSGGGSDSMGDGGPRRQVKMIVKVRKKQPKYILSKYSPIKFSVPRMDEWSKEAIDRSLAEATADQYQAGTEGSGSGTGPGSGKLGYGKGKGAGFGTGRLSGLIRFLRIQYDGGDWDNNLSEGADVNMLLEFRSRSGMKVSKEAETRTLRELANFRMYASPPLVYITGQRDLLVSSREVEVLRQYLIDRHGMILADNCGSPQWGRRFREVMHQVLPHIQPAYVPLDDTIFQRPYPLEALPYASPHDPPMQAMGWNVDGRWVALYHPGDIGDAWKSGHSGISQGVVESAYQFGVNVIYYAHLRYAMWIEATKGTQ